MTRNGLATGDTRAVSKNQVPNSLFIVWALSLN
jgi:hypothetical protein